MTISAHRFRYTTNLYRVQAARLPPLVKTVDIELE